MEEFNEKYIEYNRKIILLFLEKLELFTMEERIELLKTIKYINNPMFITN